VRPAHLLPVDQPPDDCPCEHPPERLCCVEAVAGRETDPPGGELFRAQLADGSLSEDRNRFAEQPAQLLDRHLLDVVLRQVHLNELGERQRS
jgi:hypothetical protein